MITRALIIVAALLALLSGGLGIYGRHQALRANQAERALALSDQARAELAAELKVQAAAVDELRAAGEIQARRLREAGDEAGKIRREGEARVQHLLMAPAPQDPQELATWAAAQAQDLNRRLEVP